VQKKQLGTTKLLTPGDQRMAGVGSTFAHFLGSAEAGIPAAMRELMKQSFSPMLFLCFGNALKLQMKL
jgi:hypothetical protein